MLVGIVGAMQEEIALICNDVQNLRRFRIGSADYYTGTLCKRQVVLARSGWGKVAASVTIATLILRFKVQTVVLIGVAGAAKKGMRVGDIVIARDLVQYDLDASPIFPKYTVPDLGISRFRTDPSLRKAALSAARKFVLTDVSRQAPKSISSRFVKKYPRVSQGLIATGDRFVSDIKTLHRIRRSLPEICCVEMEGAAAAQVCTIFNIPFVVIRIISDKAGHIAEKQFLDSISSMAAYFSRGVIRRLLPMI
jgi:adenosylhomocysteine nucleosidase